MASACLVLRLREIRRACGIQIDHSAVGERTDTLEAAELSLDFEAHEFHAALPHCIGRAPTCNVRANHNE
ncbi:MAG: hypothetical protein ACXW2A_17825 [Burkholderiales bacterium]